MPKTLRFYPVLLRYLGLIVGRVGGFGGNPGQIPPSPSGNVPGVPPSRPPPHHRREEIIEFTGKVVSLIYDRFGDFAGFRLLTEHGHEHEFRGREHGGRGAGQERMDRAIGHQRACRASIAATGRRRSC